MWVLVYHLDIQCEYLLIIWTSSVSTCLSSGHPVWVLVCHLDLQCEYLFIIWSSSVSTCLSSGPPVWVLVCHLDLQCEYLIIIWSSSVSTCLSSGHPVWVLVCHLDLQCEYLLIIWSSSVSTCLSSGPPVWVLDNHLVIQCKYLFVIWSSSVSTCLSSGPPVWVLVNHLKQRGLNLQPFKSWTVNHTFYITLLSFPQMPQKTHRCQRFPPAQWWRANQWLWPAGLMQTQQSSTTPGTERLDLNLSSCRLDIITPTSWQTLHTVHGMAVMHKTCMANATLRFNLMFSVSTKTNLKLI